MAIGLRESHRWCDSRIGTHLASIPGAHGTWTPHQIAALAGSPHQTSPDRAPTC
jgi:hypothetical protein